MSNQPIRLYRFALSGHAHRVELFLALLGLPVELVDVDLAAGAQRAPEFLALNPFGQVPVIVDGDVTIADSNAILVYLARRYDAAGTWLPSDPVGEARVQQWLSAAAGPLAFGPSAARVAVLFGGAVDRARALGIAERLFATLDAHLADRRFLVGEAPTIADVALYSYTAVAPEGGCDMAPYGNVRAWIDRLEALPGFLPMPRTVVPAAIAAAV